MKLIVCRDLGTAVVSRPHSADAFDVPAHQEYCAVRPERGGAVSLCCRRDEDESDIIRVARCTKGLLLAPIKARIIWPSQFRMFLHMRMGQLARMKERTASASPRHGLRPVLLQSGLFSDCNLEITSMYAVFGAPPSMAAIGLRVARGNATSLLKNLDREKGSSRGVNFCPNRRDPSIV